MIITKLQGGLGNQMFQYALGRVLSNKKSVDLKYDDCELNKVGPTGAFRSLEIDAFNICANKASAEEIKNFLPNMWQKKLFYFLKKPIITKKYFCEQNFNFNKNVFNLSNNCYLEGYFQSEKYFVDLEDIIRKDFTLRNTPTNKTVNWTNKINECNSVSLHIRRGDYVNNQVVNQFHGTCDLNYYERAIKILAEKIKTPTFFIFSDDIEWAKNNLRIDFPIYFVSDKEIPDYEELIIMSKCKHNIIANSSFSWWGAWLNGNPDKIVIAPQKWFQDFKINTSDMIPISWIKI